MPVEAQGKFARMQFIAPEDIRVMYNGEKINFGVKPLELEDIVIVPIRAIFEKMGAEVIWNGKTKTVAANLGDKKVSMKIDSDIVYVNGEQIKTAVPIKAFNERAFIPIYAIAEIYDCTVRLNENEKTVVIEK